MSLPEAFVARIEAQLGPEASAFFSALEQDPEVSILVNPRKAYPSDHNSVAWNSHGRRLPERPEYVKDPHYHGGAYYPQEASSMVIHHIVSQLPLEHKVLALDLCAAPGGKSLDLLHALGARVHLVSNEVIKARLNILQENLTKAGYHQVSYSSIHPSAWASESELFDLILVDAPCSGEGMFRRGDTARNEWSEENVSFCAARQESILKDIVPCLNDGGMLIYSTCTYAEAENLERMDQLQGLGLKAVPIQMEEEWGFTPIGTQGNAYQAYPHKVQGEGLFFAVYQKPGEQYPLPSSAVKATHDLPWELDIPAGYEVTSDGEKRSLESSSFQDELDRIDALQGFFQRGPEIGSFKADKFIPAQALANMGLDMDVKHIELNLDQSISYLRRETFPLADLEDGWYLAGYEGTVLGWIKIAAGRMKNHYPKSWMIRKRW